MTWSDEMVNGLDEQIERLSALNAELLEAGNDLVDAVLTAAPSTMYPKIVTDAIAAWQAAQRKAEGR